MLQGHVIVLVAFAYLGLLFAIAYYADQRADAGPLGHRQSLHLRAVARGLRDGLDVLRLASGARRATASASCRSTSARR